MTNIAPLKPYDQLSPYRKMYPAFTDPNPIPKHRSSSENMVQPDRSKIAQFNEILPYVDHKLSGQTGLINKARDYRFKEEHGLLTVYDEQVIYPELETRIPSTVRSTMSDGFWKWGKLHLPALQLWDDISSPIVITETAPGQTSTKLFQSHSKPEERILQVKWRPRLMFKDTYVQLLARNDHELKFNAKGEILMKVPLNCFFSLRFDIPRQTNQGNDFRGVFLLDLGKAYWYFNKPKD